MNNAASGFSKRSKQEKIEWIANTYFQDASTATEFLKSYWNNDPKLQQLYDEFIENTITNFYVPLGVAPNFLINGNSFTLPMATEESSVVAAASKSAKFWSSRGGFRTSVIGTEKVGQVHFIYKGNVRKLQFIFEDTKPQFLTDTEPITRNMQLRGGGITGIGLRDKTADIPGYFQVHATFDTKDSMGANFINSCLEQFALTLKNAVQKSPDLTDEEKNIEIVMSILSNYVPNCIVRAEVSCPVAALADKHIDDPNLFAEKFLMAVKIAQLEPFRAVTHNKGIMNGVDAVVLATGNDFRAVEAGVHAYASRDGQYRSLTQAKIEDGIFSFWLEIPLALGTVGGLTSLHPLAKFALQMLKNPSAPELMQIVAAAGLAQNFAALRSLTTTGIQHGHMKMHLNNILSKLSASDEERAMARKHFKSHTVSHAGVANYITDLRDRK